MDREAYEERLAIALLELDDGLDFMHAYRIAGDTGRNTRLARVASAAAAADWEPAKEWCRYERARFGEEMARELMRWIQKVVRDELELKRMLSMR